MRGIDAKSDLASIGTDVDAQTSVIAVSVCHDILLPNPSNQNYKVVQKWYSDERVWSKMGGQVGRVGHFQFSI